MENIELTNQFVLILATIAAALTAGSVIWAKAIKPMGRLFKIIHQTYEKVMEYDDRLEVVEERSKQLVNNSGSSLKDAVDRIEQTQTSQGAQITAQGEALEKHIEQSRDEALKIWQNLASRDLVHAAVKTIEKGNDEQLF